MDIFEKYKYSDGQSEYEDEEIKKMLEKYDDKTQKDKEQSEEHKERIRKKIQLNEIMMGSKYSDEPYLVRVYKEENGEHPSEEHTEKYYGVKAVTSRQLAAMKLLNLNFCTESYRSRKCQDTERYEKVEGELTEEEKNILEQKQKEIYMITEELPGRKLEDEFGKVFIDHDGIKRLGSLSDRERTEVLNDCSVYATVESALLTLGLEFFEQRFLTEDQINKILEEAEKENRKSEKRGILSFAKIKEALRMRFSERGER